MARLGAEEGGQASAALSDVDTVAATAGMVVAGAGATLLHIRYGANTHVLYDGRRQGQMLQMEPSNGTFCIAGYSLYIQPLHL